MEKRENHRRMKGTAWMRIGELEMMTALLSVRVGMMMPLRLRHFL
jgi:hypothetical protein